jgi:hypothetical protein
MYDVIGYYPFDTTTETYGEPFCATCAPLHSEGVCDCCSAWTLATAQPIDSDMDSDTPTHCVICESIIPHTLTVDGVAYVFEALELGTGRPEILAMWRETYAEDMADTRREIERIGLEWAQEDALRGN